MASRTRTTLRRFLAGGSLLLLAALSLSVSGCGLFYRNRYRDERFVVFSDLNPAFVNRIGPDVKEMYRGYQQLFDLSGDRLGRTAIILKGDIRDQEVLDMAYSPSLLGYYIPFLNLISVDTKPAWTREPVMLRQILLHEIAHHFIVTQYPPASRECWLNEGLAGNLEVTLFENGRFEYPLLNPLLLGIARHSVMIDPSAGDLRKLLFLGWSEFHGDNQKELDYALSWSVVYFMLEHYFPQEVPLGERIAQLYRFDRELLAGMQDRWVDFLQRFDLAGTLVEMTRADPAASRGQLTPRWAARQLGALKFLDSSRTVPALVELLDSKDPVLRVEASLAFLKILGREPDPNRAQVAAARGRETIMARLLDQGQPAVMRQALTSEVGEILRSDPRWVPILIRLLEAQEGEVRAAAAHGLSASLMKPTIVNPAFWRDGGSSARAREVEEWRSWWALHQAELTSR
jgi:hypothetical protein